jgi:hypothetical protein
MGNENNSLVIIRRREKGENRGKHGLYIYKKWHVALGYSERGKKRLI